MKYKLQLIAVLSSFLFTVENVHAEVKIIQVKGNVLVRFGLEESWQQAQVGIILKDIDSIFSAENAFVILEMSDGTCFKLGSNAILDISDIRKIQQRELFMYLMSQKIDRIDVQDENVKVKVGNVSVVHGHRKRLPEYVETDSMKVDWYPFELNGALALFDQQYFPNTVIKLIKIQNKYGSERDAGKIDYYIAKSFEKLNDSAQARDAYQRALKEVNHKNIQSSTADHAWITDAKNALRRLNEN